MNKPNFHKYLLWLGWIGIQATILYNAFSKDIVGGLLNLSLCVFANGVILFIIGFGRDGRN